MATRKVLMWHALGMAALTLCVVSACKSGGKAPKMRFVDRASLEIALLIRTVDENVDDPGRAAAATAILERLGAAEGHFFAGMSAARGELRRLNALYDTEKRELEDSLTRMQKMRTKSRKEVLGIVLELNETLEDDEWMAIHAELGRKNAAWREVIQ